MADESFRGSCFCGAVQFVATGRPEAMGYCHCASCRAWAAAPVNAFTLWKPEKIRITQGEADIASFAKTPRSERKFCRKCGGHLMTMHPHWNLIDVYAATIPSFRFEPQLHVNYSEAVMTANDSLPKLRDVPKELGGTGALV